MSGYDQEFNNLGQSGLWIVWWKVWQEGIYMYHLIFFSMQSSISEETSRNFFGIKCNNFEGMQKWPRYRRSQVFKKLPLAFNKVWFLNFLDINIEKFAVVNFAIAVTETLSFWHPVLSYRLRIFLKLHFWNLLFLHKLRHCFLHL